MSGIVGVWNLDGRPIEPALLARLSATLAHRGPDGDGLWVQGAMGLACRLLRVTPESSEETQPLVDASGAALVFDGRLDNREELLAILEVPAGCPDPALVLAAYQAFGERFTERLAGDFALGLFDPSRQQLLLARDAIGVRPLYYCRAGDAFLFASEIKALLAHPRVSARPADDDLALYLLGGSAYDYRGLTFFEGVSSLLPAHLAILTPERFVIRRYWDFDPCRRTRLGSFGEYAEAFRDHFERAVRRRLRSAYPVAVSVSGGVDSSSIFCVAETLRRHRPDRQPAILGLSYTSADGSPSDEKAFLLEIERAYGIEIQRVPMGLGFLNDCRNAVWHVEAPILDEQWNSTHALLQTVCQRGARSVLTGHWADQMLFDQAHLIDLVYRRAWGKVRAHLSEFGRWHTDVDPRYFRQRFFLDLVKYSVPSALLQALRRFRPKPVLPWYTEALRKRAHWSASKQPVSLGSFITAHARSLYEQARSSHHVLCMEWDNKVASMHGLEIAFPFLDRDLLAFLMGIPGDMQTWNGIPKAILREAMRGVLPNPIRERRWKADFTDLVNAGMEQEYPQLVRCLQSDGMAIKLGYVKGDVLRKELARLKDRIRGPSADLAWSLSDLLGLELWLQTFFGENTNEAERPLTTGTGGAR